MAGTISVSFRLHGLARQGADGGSREVALEVPEGATAGQVLADLGIHHEAEASLLVAGHVVGWGYVLSEADEVVVVPPLAGGVG